MTQQIHIDLPQELPEEELQKAQQRAKEAVYMQLFEGDYLTEKQVMDILALTRREFHGLMKRYAITYLRTEADAQEELAASDALLTLWNSKKNPTS